MYWLNWEPITMDHHYDQLDWSQEGLGVLRVAAHILGEGTLSIWIHSGMVVLH